MPNFWAISAYDPVFGYAWNLLRVLSKLPSIDFWKKIPKKMTLIFVKIRWPAIWTEKLGKTGVAGDVQILA